MGLRDLFRRRPDHFVSMLLDQAEVTRKGMRALEEFARSGDAAIGDQVIELEKEEDELRRILIDELNRRFVTPIDREDIFALSRTIDDVIDYAATTVDEMKLLEVKPSARVHEMTVILRDAAEELYLAVRYLKDRPQVANEHAVRAKELENQAERVYRVALRELFTHVESLQEVVYILKMREVYRHLSNAADRGDEAANIIGDIVVKMT